MTRDSLTRSNSSTSTLSCITVANDAQPAATTIQSSTPPTSVTDAASVSSGNTIKESGMNTPVGRARRVRSNVLSYNENALADSVRKGLSDKKHLAATRDVSDATLVPDPDDASIVQQGVSALDIDWSLGDLPGKDLRQPTGMASSKKGRSLRSQIVDKASSAVSKTTSVLGKRGHDAMEAGRETLQNLGRRASLRSRDPPNAAVQVSEEPHRKKAKSSNPPAPEVVKPIIARPKRKKYLSQGLYVGQESNFDPRLKGSKNKGKVINAPLQHSRYLPPPMFAGKTLLEQGRNFRLPYNIFSPLPPGQPKPEEWRKTQKNVFVGDAAEFWKTSKKLEHSTCICEPDSGCDENCFNRFMFYECDENNCNIGPDRCTNRSFEDLRKRCKKGGKYNIGVEVIKTADRGYGVRSNRTFEPNQIIVEYTGEIITQDECDNRMRKEYKNNECFYLMVFDQNMIIDATRGSIARFVNHACEPNCKMVKWTVAGKPRMALFAGEKGITTGEELTYDYNFDPFSSKNIQECRCGASSCRGVLGPRPKERELKDALKPVTQLGTKRKIQDALTGAKDAVQSALGKKRKATIPKSEKKVIGNMKGQATLTHSKKRPTAVVTFKKRGKQTVAASKSETSKIRTQPIAAAASVRRNVVHTVRGRNRPSGRAKSIRVIS